MRLTKTETGARRRFHIFTFRGRPLNVIELSIDFQLRGPFVVFLGFGALTCLNVCFRLLDLCLCFGLRRISGIHSRIARRLFELPVSGFEPVFGDVNAICAFFRSTVAICISLALA